MSKIVSKVLKVGPDKRDILVLKKSEQLDVDLLSYWHERYRSAISYVFNFNIFIKNNTI